MTKDAFEKIATGLLDALDVVKGRAVISAVEFNPDGSVKRIEMVTPQWNADWLKNPKLAAAQGIAPDSIADAGRVHFAGFSESLPWLPPIR